MYKSTKIFISLAGFAAFISAAVFLPKVFAKPNRIQTVSSAAQQPSVSASNSSVAQQPQQLKSSASNASDNLSASSRSSATTTSTAVQQAAVIANDQTPITLKIPAIGLTAPVVKTGLEADGSLHVPSDPNLSGWYDLGPKPGDVGPAVITGHLDSAYGPGVFINLKNIKPGNEIDVVRDDGSVAVFTVDKLEQYPQDNFNTQAVYGSIPNAGLRIITCSGIYSRQTGHYSDDLVVYASLTTIKQPGKYLPL